MAECGSRCEIKDPSPSPRREDFIEKSRAASVATYDTFEASSTGCGFIIVTIGEKISSSRHTSNKRNLYHKWHRLQHPINGGRLAPKNSQASQLSCFRLSPWGRLSLPWFNAQVPDMNTVGTFAPHHEAKLSGKDSKDTQHR